MQRLTLPLFVQVWSLLLVTLVAAQAINLGLLFSLPPPIPDVYGVNDVAAALKPRGADGPNTRPLVRTTSIQMRRWQARDQASPMEEEAVQELSRLLHVPPETLRVRLQWRGPGPGASSPLRLRTTPSQSEQRLFRAVFFAPFEVALRQADGTWTVVAPPRQSGLTGWQWRILLSFLASAALVVPMAYVFARRFSAPISALASAAERLGRDLDAPELTLRGSAELRTLVEALNGMQERLRLYLHDRTAMIGAIAHDLRTPLTRMRFHLEATSGEPRRRLERDVAQMEAMIRAVLGFVRDAHSPAVRTKLEVTSLLEGVADEMSERGADITVEAADAVVMEADPVALHRLFTNLMENALKFGERAIVRVTTSPTEVVVEIDDAGPGLSQADLDLVFKPFYRTEPSRNRDTGGIGLGLASARSIARAHGGDVALANIEGGLRVTVRLPL